MLLLLIRHARAPERDAERWPDDRLRPLTNAGRATHARMSRTLARLDLEPGLMLTSPWVRAMQTADIMIDELGLDIDATECAALAAEPDVAAIAQCIGDQPDDATVALVGHSPFLEDLASLLLAGSTGVGIDLPKSGVMGLETDAVAAGQAALRFFLRPRQTERIRRRK